MVGVMQRIGILGGTFDPPHVGHLILAEYSAEALELDHLFFVPAADPPHKQGETKTPVYHRLAMLQCAIADNARFSLSRIDVDRPGPHYSLDMVRIVRDEFPQSDIYFVMGGDSFRDLPTWHNPQALIALCTIVVMRRPYDHIRPDMHEAILPRLATRVILIDAPLLEISSTDIGERLRQGRSVRYLVPDTVLTYINENNLYQDAE
jgi:nicotinate-nucleotide adenylyltransferase